MGRETAQLIGTYHVADNADEEEEEEEEEREEADVFFDEDIYDATIVAAFGGVTINLDGESQLNVHPFWPLLASFFLFEIQHNILFAWKLSSFNLELKVSKHGDAKHYLHSDHIGMDLTMKLVMILVLQMMIFKEVIGSVRLLVFCLNPTAWLEIERPDPKKFSREYKFIPIYRSEILCIFSCLAMFMKVYIAYQVATDSLSVILGSENLLDAIKDALVITFIADMDEVFWRVCVTIFHLEQLDAFVFVLADSNFRDQCKESAWLYTLLKHSGCNTRIEYLFSRAKKCYGRSAELILSYFLVFIIYFRQVLVLLFALDTDILPINRDVCNFHRWETHPEIDSMNVWKTWYGASRRICGIFDARTSVAHIVEGKEDKCMSAELDRMRGSDMSRMFWQHSGLCILMMSVMVAIALGPLLLSKILATYNPQKAKRQDKDEVRNLRKQVSDLKKSHQELMLAFRDFGNNAGTPDAQRKVVRELEKTMSRSSLHRRSLIGPAAQSVSS